MPKVGGKHFSYDAGGKAAAREESARTGLPVENKKTYQTGGLASRKPEAARLKKRGDKLSRARGCKVV